MGAPVLSASATVCRDNSTLDPDEFPSFSGLLQASQENARLNGCRFRSTSFDFIQQEFATRIRNGEPQLVEELDRAYRLNLEEGVRKAMVATCLGLELWPPSPASITREPSQLYEAFPAMAQAIYEEEMSRHGGEDDWFARFISSQLRTATFLADFGAAVCPLQPPPGCPAATSQEFNETLEKFNELALIWEQHCSEQPLCLCNCSGARSVSTKDVPESPWCVITRFSAASLKIAHMPQKLFSTQV